MKDHRFFSRLAAALLTLVLMMQPLLALAEEVQPITHTAKATVALKVRRAPSKDAGGCGSITRGETVSIIEYGDSWCKVQLSRNTGYVQTRYLTDVQVQDGYTEPEAQPETRKEAEGEVAPGFTTNKSNFYQGYYAHAVKDLAVIYSEPSEKGKWLDEVEAYKQVIVSEVSGDWAFVCYRGSVYGYMRLKDLFKWDRIDPYVGDIPGLEVWPNLIFLNKTVTIYDIDSGEKLQTVNPGSAMAAGEKDEQGRYPVPYDRVTGYVNEVDVAYVMPVANWDQAEAGDLISTMTTFFAVGKSTLQYQGRNWNIHLASTMLSGVVLQPGEGLDMNETIGPYRKSSGYKSAPIMSSKSLSGYGGGTCQVNTTFYIATIQVPLLVTHRKVHAEVGMYYAEKGFDAAVGGGDINLTMVNTLPYAVRYEFMNSDGVLTCCIFRDS